VLTGWCVRHIRSLSSECTRSVGNGPGAKLSENPATIALPGHNGMCINGLCVKRRRRGRKNRGNTSRSEATPTVQRKAEVVHEQFEAQSFGDEHMWEKNMKTRLGMLFTFCCHLLTIVLFGGCVSFSLPKFSSVAVSLSPCLR
jgi:hypothetical protein